MRRVKPGSCENQAFRCFFWEKKFGIRRMELGQNSKTGSNRRRKCKALNLHYVFNIFMCIRGGGENVSQRRSLSRSRWDINFCVLKTLICKFRKYLAYLLLGMFDISKMLGVYVICPDILSEIWNDVTLIDFSFRYVSNC